MATEQHSRFLGFNAARYFDVEVDDNSLVPGPDARLGAVRFESWLSQQQMRA